MTAAHPAIPTPEEEAAAAAVDPNVLRNAFRKLESKGFATPKKAERRQRELKARSVVDGRSLRATGRTAQFNFKCTPEIKALVHETADREGLTVAEWMERAVLAVLRGN
jgi:hypothetical protein